MAEDFLHDKKMKTDGLGWYVYDETGFMIEEVTTNGEGQWTELKQWNAAKKAYEIRLPGERDLHDFEQPGYYDE